jgi:hypothetical protein
MATFVHVAPIDEPGFTDPALDLARHVYTMMDQDPSGIDEKISDQKVSTSPAGLGSPGRGGGRGSYVLEQHCLIGALHSSAWRPAFRTWQCAGFLASYTILAR